MSGVSLEDPFLLAEFNTTSSQDQALSVQCTPAGAPKNTADAFSETSDGTEDQDASLLVVAVQGEGVQLFNTADQNCIHSYSTPPGFTFQSPAKTILKGKGTRHVYAVIGKGTDITAKEEGKVVWMWKDESVASKKADSQEKSTTAMDIDEEASSSPSPSRTSTATKTVKKFDRSIHELFVSAALSNHILLVNTDASISLVTDDLKRVVSTTKESVSAEATLAWTTTFTSTSSWIPPSILSRNTVVVATVTANDAQMKIAFSFVNEDHRGLSTLGHVTLEEQHANRATAIAFDTTTGQLSYLSAQGQLKIFQCDVIIKDRKITATETLSWPLPGFVPKSAAAPTAPTKSKKKSTKATATAPSDLIHQRTASLALGNHYIAIAGIHELGGQSEQTLTIWDARYGTLQAKHTLPGSHNAQQTTCQLSVAPDSAIAVTFSTPHGNTVRSRVHLCSFYSEPVSLLSAMGRLKATAPFFGMSSSATDATTTTMTVSQANLLSATTTSLLMPTTNGGGATLRGKDLVLTDFEKRVEQTQQEEAKVLETLMKVQGGSGKKDQGDSSTAAEAFSKLFFKHVEKQTAMALKDMMEKYHVEVDDAQAAVAKDEERKKSKQAKAPSTTASSAMEVDAPAQKEAKKEAGEANGVDKKTKKQLKRQKKKAAAAVTAAVPATPATVRKEQEETGDGSDSESSSEDEDDDEEEAEDDEGDHGHQSSEDEYEEAAAAMEDEGEDDAAEHARMQAYLEAVSEWRKSEAEAIKQYKEFRRQLRAGRKQAPLPELSHRFVSTILGRCFQRLPNGQPDMAFWPESVVQYLMDKQLVGNANPGAGPAGLALELMEREQWTLLELALTRLYDIPEMDLVTLLKQVLGLNKANNNRNQEDMEEEEASGQKVPTSDHMLALILAAPKNEVFMQQALKRLTVEELAIVLEILKRWIQEWEERGGLGHGGLRADKKQLSSGVPGYPQIVDFTTVLMDVHFPSLILSPHLHETIRYIHQSVQTEVSISQQMEQVLRGPLGLFERKHRDSMRRKKENEQGALNQGPQGPNVIGGGGRVSADKRRRRKWEGGEGIPDYGVEIIHM
ncbi:hypothetical protein DFQ27_005040 [Actinomortierella ambigua]|uniref:Nucleolar protein 11 C-terminal domain-containing protein n=1 Tax=Actinomortierella ambigua TaxID=1343610 RepID=A0A9P6Q1B3_9FUNG|nr:hypothetical protein DFQ27_005040 [Actinomortierella ambigua]